MKKLILTIIVLACLGGVVAAYYMTRSAPEPTVATLQLTRGDVIDSVGATGGRAEYFEDHDNAWNETIRAGSSGAGDECVRIPDGVANGGYRIFIGINRCVVLIAGIQRYSDHSHKAVKTYAEKYLSHFHNLLFCLNKLRR